LRIAMTTKKVAKKCGKIYVIRGSLTQACAGTGEEMEKGE